MVTDVSIRIDTGGTAPLEIVTYCGTSTNGQFDPNPMGSGTTPLSPTANAFAAPASLVCPGTPYAAGNAANHPLGVGGAPQLQLSTNNTDGIIGRLVHDTSTGTTTRQFHCIVGGYGQDALWGLAERDFDHFAVVGTTDSMCAGPIFFPVTRPYWLQPPAAPICFACPTNYHHGVVAEFDASLVPLGGPVLLAGSTLIGASGSTTLARDVTWQGGEYYIVGSTNDPAFSGASNPCTQAKGFLVAAADLSDPSRLWTQIYTPRLTGPCEASGLVGVAAWNEHPDHVSVFGWIQEQASGPKDLFVTTLFRDTTGASAPYPLQEIRTHRFVTGSDEFASAIDGTISFPAASAASVFSYGYGGFPLGEGGGGGLAVDPLGRLTLVGSIRGPVASGYPVTLAPAGRAASAALSGLHFNGVMSRIDMLPIGVCRSDATGSCPGTGWVPTGNGGTTPACALSPFGTLLGSTTPALRRMLVDYEGVPAPGQPVSLLVDRPPQSSAVVLSAWHVSIPANTPVHFLDQDVYIWVPSVTTSTIWGTYSPTGASLRESLGVFTQTGTFMVQYVCLLSQPLTGTPCTAPDLTWAVSPALVFTY